MLNLTKIPLPIYAIVLLTMTFAFSPLNMHHFGGYSDKLGHLTIFFFISVLINRNFKYGQGLITALFAAVLFGFGVEIVQEQMPARRMDIMDALANTLGIIFGCYYYTKKRSMTTKTI